MTRRTYQAQCTHTHTHVVSPCNAYRMWRQARSTSVITFYTKANARYTRTLPTTERDCYLTRYCCTFSTRVGRYRITALSRRLSRGATSRCALFPPGTKLRVHKKVVIRESHKTHLPPDRYSQFRTGQYDRTAAPRLPGPAHRLRFLFKAAMISSSHRTHTYSTAEIIIFARE